MDILEWARAELHASAEEKYKNFHQSLVPGLTSMLGVRMPKCREIARKIAKDDWEAFLAGADDGCYEELLLQGLVIGYAKMDRKKRTEYLQDFVPRINNWAVCDCCCSTCKFMRQEPEYWLSFLRPYLDGGREFEIRFAVVCMMDHFLEEQYRKLQFEAYERIFGTDTDKNTVPFYAQMAVAWALSSWYVRFPQETEAFLKQGTLDNFTHNRAIQKIRESYRVPQEDKERLKMLRR